MIDTIGPKYEGDEFYTSFDFTAYLGAVTIASASVSAADPAGADVTATLTKAADQVISGNEVYVWVRAGVADTTYVITCAIIASDGSHYELSGMLTVYPAGVELFGLLAKVISIVRDDSAKLVNPDDYELKIAAALSAYSRARPDTDVADITGGAGHDYDLPAGWVDGFSEILYIEYPVGDVPATLLDPDEWEIYRNTTEKQIRLLTAAPPATKTFRVVYTILRTTATIPAHEEDAFCMLAAAFCLEELANAFAQSSDSTIGADAVSYRTKSSEFSARAKRCLALYKEQLGIKADDSTPAASAVSSQEMNYPGGSDRLTHPRGARRRR